MTGPERRRKRRQRRREQSERESRRNTMFTTVVVFSFASVMVSLAKAVFKFPNAFVPSLDFFLVSVGLMVLGALMLWGLYAKGGRWNTVALVVVSLLIVPVAVYFGGAYSSTIVPAKDELVRNPDMPWSSHLPEVIRSRFGSRPDLMLVVGDDRAVLGTYGSIPPRDWRATDYQLLPHVGEDPEDFEAVVREVTSQRHREREILGDETPHSIRVNADRCVDFGRVYAFDQLFSQSLTVDKGYSVIAHGGVSSMRLRMGEHDDWEGLRIALMPDHVEVQLPGSPPNRVMECPGNTRCFSVDSCLEPHDWTPVHDALDDFGGETYVLSVHPDVSMGDTVGLIDSLAWNGSEDSGYFDDYLECSRIELK